MKTVQVGVYPSAITVNPDTNMVYVVNYASNTVSVIGGSKTNPVVVAHVPVGQSPDDIAVNPDTNMVYVR